MNYRKWPVQSVLWLYTSVSTFVLSIGWDLYKWQVRGKPFDPGKLFDDCVFAVVVGWTATLSSQARGVAFLTGVVAVFLTLIIYLKLEQTVHLSSLADAVCERMAVLLPLLVAVGAGLFWRRRERLREIRTMR